ncbi:MAG: site-specific DNA-methyltransferase [Comamonadaceae bacterium]|nr:site-specific DNA-methyltransferase [Comamonadaceae bacterium]
MTRQKLELTWIGKDQRPRLEPRILLEDPARSYHAKQRVTENDLFDNRLIKGDNLLALKALEAEFTGKVKCVFIDPPYNTGSAFTHYDDGLEHSIWLGLMRDRLEIIRRLLAEDGSLWITIDDNEAHYLKVLCDEVFGRKNYLNTVCWEKVYTLKNTAKHFSEMHDFVLVYSKDIQRVFFQPLPRGEKQNQSFTNRDGDPRGPWLDSAVHARNFYSKGSYVVVSPGGKSFSPPPGRYWTVSEDNFRALDVDSRIWWGKDGNNAPRKKTFLAEVKGGIVPGTIWSHEEAGQNAEAKAEIKALIGEGDEVFITPKPERLIQRVLSIATSSGDLVLDSFAGSGTTGAVAHKMGRRWIMVELGEHCHTHIVPRLQKVIDGQDPGGVTQATGWQGGGGFRYYELAPTLLSTDRWGNLVINPEYDATMLAAAMCKLEGFSYAPSEVLWWQQGRSSERDFIYVTTQTMSAEQLEALSTEVGEERSLLVCCAAYRGVTAAQTAERWPNLTIKKIPKMVKDRCEWGHDDYSLNVANLPMAQKPVAEVAAQDDLFARDEA